MESVTSEYSQNHEENQYTDLIKRILEKGSEEQSRNGKVLSVFGNSMRFSLQNGTIPLLTTKKVAWKTCFKELMWFVKGSTSNDELRSKKVYIWNDNSSREFLDSRGLTNNREGDLGPVYGHQWRNWNSDGVDQIKDLINQIKTNPNSRRMIVSAWNPSVLPDTSKSFSENIANGKAALPPCHAFFQFYVSEGKLSCQLYQRSADTFLGVPFNIASYALFTMMIAQVTDLVPGDFVHTFGDVHLYNNHIEQAKLQLERDTKSLPKMIINPEIKNIFDFKYEDFQLVDYNPHPHIKAAVSI